MENNKIILQNEKRKLTKVQKKKQMILNMSASLGNVSASVESLGLTRQTHYAWLREDNKYASAIDEVKERSLDFVEAALFKRIQVGDTTAIIFHLKTKGKRRGYIETQHHLNTNFPQDDMKNKSLDELLEIINS